jgi:plasmid maintenance system antidote protein VapI
LHEIHAFLDEMEKILSKMPNDESAKIMLGKMDAMRQLANGRTAVTTETTIQLSDLLKSLHDQSIELSNISNALLQQMSRFTL